jgi:hypothetical protein
MRAPTTGKSGCKDANTECDADGCTGLRCAGVRSGRHFASGQDVVDANNRHDDGPEHDEALEIVPARTPFARLASLEVALGEIQRNDEKPEHQRAGRPDGGFSESVPPPLVRIEKHPCGVKEESRCDQVLHAKPPFPM